MKKLFISMFVLMVSVNVFAIEEVETDCQKMVESRDAGKSSDVQETREASGQSGVRR